MGTDRKFTEPRRSDAGLRGKLPVRPRVSLVGQNRARNSLSPSFPERALEAGSGEWVVVLRLSRGEPAWRRSGGVGHTDSVDALPKGGVR